MEAGKSAVCEFQPVRCLQRVHLECLQITLHYLKTVPEAAWHISQPLLWPIRSPNTPQWVTESNSCFLDIVYKKTKQNQKKSTKPKLCPTVCLLKNNDIDSKICPLPLWNLLPKLQTCLQDKPLIILPYWENSVNYFFPKSYITSFTIKILHNPGLSENCHCTWNLCFTLW